MQSNISVRFAGDSGDGMQLLGQQFTYNAALNGWQVQTLPDFPAEIRAHVGTVAGVSGFQVTLAEKPLFVSGDTVDVLVVLNPAALKTSVKSLKEGGVLFLNTDSFKAKDLKKAGYDSFSLEDTAWSAFQVIDIPITSLTLNALVESDLSQSVLKKAKNFFVLGIVLWLFQLDISYTLKFIKNKFKENREIEKTNQKALKAGFHYADTLELSHFPPLRKKTVSDNKQHITGIDAITKALATYAVKSKSPMLVAGYPITPASNILHQVANLGDFGLSLFQAEDEIAAVCAALGAAYAGRLAVTCTSGPGLDLKAEGLGLAVMAELPLVVVNVMRSGPSTGLPTKTEQSDLLTAVYGRHGEAPLPVIAAKSPGDCFEAVIQAFDIAIKYMTPVILLCDAYLANASELWEPPELSSLQIASPVFNRFEEPYQRDAFGARSWTVPGTPKLMYRTGGLEKAGGDGSVTYGAEQHQSMVNLREKKVANVNMGNAFEFRGKRRGDVLLISWGSTYGVSRTVVSDLSNAGGLVSMLHLRQLFPLPLELSDILKEFKQVYVVELNQGQLCGLIRNQFLVDAKSISQTNGLSFSVGLLTTILKEKLCLP